jgi:predicted RNA-binding Zn-ribbon protein involved in translation (DUF1610 family)
VTDQRSDDDALAGPIQPPPVPPPPPPPLIRAPEVPASSESPPLPPPFVRAERNAEDELGESDGDEFDESDEADEPDDLDEPDPWEPGDGVALDPAPPPSVLADRIPCRQCGAMLAYQPGTRVLACGHCGGTTPIDGIDAAVEERDLAKALQELATTQETMEVRTVACRSCGATTQVMADVAAANCPYCGTHFNITGQTSRVIRPNAVLPFAIPREQVESTLRTWIHSLWFAPNALAREAEKERMIEGIYLPYWTYDAATATTYSGSRGDHYSVTVGSGKNRRTEVRTRWRPAQGSVSRIFDDVLIPASESPLMKLADDLGDWDLAGVVPYDPRWVAGFLAEAYRVDLPTGLGQAKLVMSTRIDADIRADIGGDAQRIDRRNTSYSNVTFKHLLIPLWIGSFRYRGKVYRFLVNGRSGAVSGERPWSAWKIALAVAAGAALFAIFALFVIQR